MNFKSKKVLVTGAGGFIGSHLVQRLIAEDAEVTALVHYNSRNDWGHINTKDTDISSNLEVLTGEITDPILVKRAVQGNDIVFHLAALIGIPYSYYAPQSYVNTNILGTLNIMQASLESDVKKIVHTSTSEVYGSAQYTPIDETHPIIGQSPYSASKIGADKIAESFYHSFDLPVTTIRPFNTYGPRQSARAVIPTIISQALGNDVIKIGSLKPIRDFTYVKDTVEGFLLISQNNSAVGKTINIGTGKAISIGELVNIILDKINPELRIITEEERYRPEKSEVMELICDNTLARELLGWRQTYSLQEGIDETISWIKQNMNQFKTNIYTI